MYRSLKTAFAGLALLIGAHAASAKSLDLVGSGPSLSIGAISIDYFENAASDTRSFIGIAPITGGDGVALGTAPSLFFTATTGLSDPFAIDFGTLDASGDPNGDFLVLGDFVDFGFTDTTLEFLFDTIGGRAAGDFGSQVLLEFTIAANSGITLLSGLFDGAFPAGTATITGNLAPVSPIPLPAGLPLLLAGLGGLLVLRRYS
ncbi:VPLPA-CTERM sorting domain-containing protein [uncultured Roseobacter sp.]|uniref:VPLPA-CTERM sorting domain-containing protein n=1 Tax=uncultured Roseobacter sp. TaxID=114847 RepID=UPI00262067AD|nr:VPLPA-CTERM sorting domain-containing protein [uncultured Roseobacter sp.]